MCSVACTSGTYDRRQCQTELLNPGSECRDRDSRLITCGRLPVPRSCLAWLTLCSGSRCRRRPCVLCPCVGGWWGCPQTGCPWWQSLQTLQPGRGSGQLHRHTSSCTAQCITYSTSSLLSVSVRCPTVARLWNFQTLHAVPLPTGKTESWHVVLHAQLAVFTMPLAWLTG